MPEQLSLLGSPDPADPPDQSDRDRIRTDLDSTLFVEAGAGSGKTSALVDRIISLVEAGTDLENLAAITFTEKAAAELRQRVRDRLEGALRADPDASIMRRALHQLDGAAISTLHAFAQRLLFEHPIEAGLPPGVEVLDELASQVDFDDRWESFLPDLLDDADAAPALLTADVLGISAAGLRSMAQQLEANWDLFRDRRPVDVHPLTIDPAPLISALRAVAAHRNRAVDDSDKLFLRLREIDQWADQLATADSAGADPIDRIVDIAELLSVSEPKLTTGGNPYKQMGAKTRWQPDVDRGAILEEMWEVDQVRLAIRRDLVQQTLQHLADAVGQFVLDAVGERRDAGRLRFHDLLVLARDLLRNAEHGSRVRTELADRYNKLLIDEFQDTDPIQVDIAALLAARPGTGIDGDWQAIDTTPGRLFFVGDPKQSIYRFRRADIATYLTAQEHFGGTQGHVSLTTNFRSTHAVVDWVNTTFGALITAVPDSQPAYAALTSVRPPTPGPGVRLIGSTAHEKGLKAADLRAREAGEVAATIVDAASSWSVSERDRDGVRTERRARLGDITVLLPARTSLPALEQALEDAGIPYRAETASLVYATAEIRDLLMLARAIDDPTDELAVVAALRTAALGCGDDDLYRYRHELSGGWNHQHLVDELPDDDIVVTGMRWMAALHNDRGWLSPAQLLDRVIRERRLLQLGVCQQRHREVWRRLRFVVDQARAWTDATAGDLRQYLSWVRMQGSDSARVAETVLPETDTDAIRIMTIHASKGLQFPITILSGTTTQIQGRNSDVRVVWPPDGSIGYRVGARNTTPEYDQFTPLDEQLDVHERLRLLYVACTRACDHLVVSLHRTAESKPTLATTIATVALPGEGAEETNTAPGTVQLEAVTERTDSAAPVLPAADAWARERRDALGRAAQSRTVAATTLAQIAAEQGPDPQPGDPGLQKRGRDLDLPPWQKGRYGTSIGRAVHGVLQTVDLGGADDIEGTVAAQAAAEGVLGHEADIAARCRSALASSVVIEAAAARHWRELFVAAPVGERLLEGYIDLLYEGPDGLVVVDYKTDAWSTEQDLDRKVAHYTVQTAAYATAVERATATAVSRAVLLFCGADTAIARDVEDLRSAIDDIDALMPLVVAGGEEDVIET
jgi:ATP-dependent helicase/nuclease subunit A